MHQETTSADNKVLNEKFLNQKFLNETETLLTYSSSSRVSALLFKVFWGLSSGASNFLTFTALIATSMIWTIFGIIPGIIYAIQAGKLAYNNNLREQKLIEDIFQLITAVEKKILIEVKSNPADTNQTETDIEFAIPMALLMQILQYLQAQQVSESAENPEVESFYFYLQEINEITTRLCLLLMIKRKIAAPTEQAALDSKRETILGYLKELEKCREAVNALRGINQNEPAKETGVIITLEDAAKTDEKNTKEKAWMYTQKTSNRALAFIAGASIGLSLSVAILAASGVTVTLAFLVTNPIGWAVLGGVILFGFAAVALDYSISRRQDQKIKQLENEKLIQKQSELNSAVQLENIKTTEEHMALKEKNAVLEKENKALAEKNAALEKQVQAIPTSSNENTFNINHTPRPEPTSPVDEKDDEELNQLRKEVSDLKRQNELFIQLNNELTSARKLDKEEIKILGKQKEILAKQVQQSNAPQSSAIDIASKKQKTGEGQSAYSYPYNNLHLFPEKNKTETKDSPVANKVTHPHR